MKTGKQKQRHLGFKIKTKLINEDESNAILIYSYLHLGIKTCHKQLEQLTDVNCFVYTFL